MPTQRLASASASSSASSTTTARVAPGQERTAKGHGLLELLHQTRHHNEGARAAGVQGLKELVTAHPGLGQREMATLLDGALELLLDPEEDVRRAALGLLRVLLLPSSSSAARSSSGPSLSAGVSDKGGGSGGGGDRHRASLLPFAPLAATYLCAALSHLDQSVRRDGLAYLDLLVQSLGPHLLPHAGGVLPSLASLLDRPPNPSKRQAARLLLQQKQAAAQGGGDESGMSAKEKDQHLKTRMELWAARAAVLRCALGLARLLPHTQAAGSAPQPLQGQQGQGQQAPSTPVVVEWRRTPRLLLLRPMQPSPQQPQETGPAAAEAEDGGQQDGGGVQSVEGLAALLSRVRNYVLELSSTTTSITISTGAAAAAAMDVDGGGEEEGAGGGEAPPPKGQGQGQGRHQVEGGPALDALAGAIEFALVATQCLAANSAVSVGSAGAGGEGEEGEEDDAAVGAAVGETRALIGALVALFPLQLADGATALRTSSSAAAAADNEEEEGEEGGGIVTEDGLNLALAEVAMLEGTAIDPGSRLKNNKQQQQQGGGLDAGVVAWLLALMARRARALGGGGTAEGERLGARLLRLLRGLLPRLYRRGEARVAERLVGALGAWVVCGCFWLSWTYIRKKGRVGASPVPNP